MSIFNKFAVMIAFAVCTTNAWAGICAPQKVEKLNNDKYFLYADDGDIKYAFVCGGGGKYDCSNGTKLYIDKFVPDPYIAHRNKKEVAYIVECSDKTIDSKWVNKTDVGIGSLKKCSYDQWKKWGNHRVNFNSGDVFCKEMSGGFSCGCVSMNNEDVCYLDYPTLQEFVQQAAEEEAKNSENKASETKTDCGNVGQRECDGDYKFYVCETNADCGSEHLPSHATAGHCVSAGRSGYKVCTATNCGENYELARDKNDNSMGWCRKKSADKNEETGGADDEGQDAGMSNNGESESGAATLTTVFNDLDKFISEKFVGSSVWKNDEGNFNTARLVSDSVAGVVLGTVGGVITSHIIKKNQIENGFDDLKCTIGGQTVASYGDEFRVGVK